MGFIKSILGTIIFVIGIGVYIKEAIVYDVWQKTTIPDWIGIIIFIVIAIALELLFSGSKDAIKEEMQGKIDELQNQIDELKG